MPTEKLSFTGHAGDTLAARLDMPEGPHLATALFAHCFTCSKDITAARRIAARLSGMGIAVLPDYLVHNRQKLVRVLPEVEGNSFNSYFCYPPELRGSLRVALFRDFLVRQIRAESNIL